MTSDLVYEVLRLDYLRLNSIAPTLPRTRISASEDLRCCTERKKTAVKNIDCGAGLMDLE